MQQAIELKADGWTSEELWQQSEIQFVALTNLGKLVDKVAKWCMEATDETERTRLWDQYAGLCRDYTVLMSWYNITYSAAIFAESGSDLRTVTIQGLQLAG